MTYDPRVTGAWDDDHAAWMENFARTNGVAAALDHLHLTGIANDWSRREAVVKAARELAVIEFDPHEGPPDPVVFWSRLTRLRAALDPTEVPDDPYREAAEGFEREWMTRGTTP